MHSLEIYKQLWCLICRRAEKPLTLNQKHLKIDLFSTYCLHTSKTSITQSSVPGEYSSQKAAFCYILCSPKEKNTLHNQPLQEWLKTPAAEEGKPACICSGSEQKKQFSVSVIWYLLPSLHLLCILNRTWLMNILSTTPPKWQFNSLGPRLKSQRKVKLWITSPWYTALDLSQGAEQPTKLRGKCQKVWWEVVPRIGSKDVIVLLAEAVFIE